MSWVGNSDIAKVAQMAMDDRGDTEMVKSVSRNLVVPKHSSIAVNAIVHGKTRQEDTQALLVPTIINDSTGLQLSDTLVKVTKGKNTRLMVTNSSSKDRILQKGSQLGVLEMINSVTFGYITNKNSAALTENGDLRSCRDGGAKSPEVSNSDKWEPPIDLSCSGLDAGQGAAVRSLLHDLPVLTGS